MAELTRDEKLVLLIEECAEVIQAATKCLRFGWDREYSDQGVNHEALAAEVGDVLGVIQALKLNQAIVDQRVACKMHTAEIAKAGYGVRSPPIEES